MQTKLTLRLDDNLIRRAKVFAKANGKSLSRVVADYFALLGGAEEVREGSTTPKVARLKGALRGQDLSERDYRRHLEQKHL